jgi:hypothetical protein
VKVRRPLTDQVADVGVAAVQSAVAGPLKWVFREQNHDYGIDAHVEVVEDEVVSGRLLAVQIKSGPSWFDEPYDAGWWFRPDREHVEYWLNHSLPVAVILHDPKTGLCLPVRRPPISSGWPSDWTTTPGRRPPGMPTLRWYRRRSSENSRSLAKDAKSTMLTSSPTVAHGW